MFLVDSHAHLNFEAFDKDREKIIEKCQKEKILVVNVGVNYETSKKACIVLNKEYDFEKIGFKVLDMEKLRMHRTLTRFIYVLQCD